MPRTYTASIKATDLSAGRTMIYLTVPSTNVIEIVSAEITNPEIEANEQLEACLQYISSVGTPAKTDLTPAKHASGDPASTVTAAGSVSASEPSYTSNTEIGRAGFASLAGYRFEPPPDARPTVAPGASIGLRLLTSSFTEMDIVASITYRELN